MVLGEARNSQGLLKVEAVRVELVLATSENGSLQETLLVDNIGNVVETVADSLTELDSEAVLVVIHRHDKQGAVAGDRDQRLGLGGKDLECWGHIC